MDNYYAYGEQDGHEYARPVQRFDIWYDKRSGWYEPGGTYWATTEEEALEMARADGLRWAHVIASDTDPN